MSKKRAFVRYTKSGEIVPGSLIITTNGGYPDKSSLWKEVTVDQCCPDDGGSTTRLTSSAFDPSTIAFQIICNSTNYIFGLEFYSGTTAEEWITFFNTFFGSMGTFSLNPNNPGQVFFDIKTEVLNSICNGETATLSIVAV